MFRQSDVTVEEQMKALIAVSVEKFGRIDCRFNNAGGPAQAGGRNWSQQQRVWCYRTIPE
jgi:NAD(P)-dependent dehydrogenase (short-subunit alcohol dehydrogenase family)